MSVSAHFNAPTAAALVLGGTAAIVLATVMALRHGQADSSVSAEPQAAESGTTSLPPATVGGAPSEAEVEYLLDTSD